MKKRQEFIDNINDNINDSIELMISILLRYPEINTVKTDPKSEEIIFSFLLNKKLSQNEFLNFENRLKDSIETYLFIQKSTPVTLEVRKNAYQGYTLIELVRDFQTITQPELSLINQVVNESLGPYLLVEQNVNPDIEELEAQEEIIEDLLLRLQYHKQGDLIGFRESGKVLVFHKTNA